MSELTHEEARALLARAVEEKGADYVYPEFETGCSYLDGEGNPSCLVGFVLTYAGVSGFEIENCEGTQAAEVVGSIFPDTEDRVRAALRAAQQVQDNGGTWAEAVVEFDRVVGEANEYEWRSNL